MTIRTLVVDDDFAVAKMHRRFVEALGGFEVAGVLERGLPVAAFLDEHEVDLVLLDVHLPDRNGVDVLRDLRAGGHDVAVVMVTAASEQDTVRRAVGLGVDGYLVKPFAREDFNARLLEIAELFRDAEAAGAGAEQRELEQAEIDELVRGAAGRDPAEATVGSDLQATSAAAAATAATAAAASGGPGPLPGRLPKGYSAPTLEIVATALREAGAGVDRSSGEVAETCGISLVSARRYLGFLVSTGHAELRPRYGTTGRPQNRYRWIA